MPLKPLSLIFLAGLIAVAFICHARRTLALRQSHLSVTQSELENLRQQARVLKADVALRRLDLEALPRTVPTTINIPGKFRDDADSQWAKPPASLPYWDSASPYVWLPKPSLKAIDLTPLSDNAELDPNLAAALAIDEKDRLELNGKLQNLLQQYQGIEAQAALAVTNHLPGIQNEKGEKVTIIIQPIPDESARLQQEFRSTIYGALGDERGELVLNDAQSWLNKNMASDSNQPKTISAARREDGTFSISIRTSGSWISTSGPLSLEKYVPPHLLPFFAPLGGL